MHFLGRGIAVDDLDGDGNPDIVVGGYDTGTTAVFMGLDGGNLWQEA